ncbi:MAG TPA: carboxypeptidase-like regulatory domain-containing protein [Methanocella sp.]|jgi:hypothetical protein
MSRLSTGFAIMLAIACVFFSCALAFASEPTANQPYPPVPPGESSGGVTCRVVTGDPQQGAADAFVAIVNASNVSVVYATGRTDSAGNHTFEDVSSTGGISAYRVVAIVSGEYYEEYSSPFPVEPSGTAYVILAPDRVGAPSPAFGSKYPGSGHVSGRIKMANGEPMPDAVVTIINSENWETVYVGGTTDSDGYYSVDLNRVSSGPSFQLRVSKSPFMDAYSASFPVSPYTPAVVNLVHNNALPTPTPNPTPTPTPTPTPSPTPTPTPTPKPTSSPAPTWTAGPTEDPATPTPHPTAVTATGTPSPSASSTPLPTPGFAAFITMISVAGAVVYKKLR